MTTQSKEFVEFEGIEVSEALKTGLGRAIAQGAKEAARAHQDRQRQLARAFGKSDRFCGSLDEKIARLKAIKITVSPLPPQQTTKESRAERLARFREEMGPEFFDKLGERISEGLREVNRHRTALRNYRSWAWARNQGLIIKTGRGR